MGKKRKMTPISRGRLDAKEEKSPPGEDDVMVARDRLKGALQFLIDQSEDSSECSHDEASASAATDGYSKSQAHLLHSPKKENNPAALGSSLGSSMQHRGQRKRRRRGEVPVGDAAYHHTYVMKLFDRSVDLAQFREDTPLYPVCRAWMANQPRNTSLAIKRERTPTPEPPDDSTMMSNGSPSGDDGADRRAEGMSLPNGSGEGKDMYKLPAPHPIAPGKTQRDIRMPSPVLYEKEPEIDDLELYLNIQKDGYIKPDGVSCPSTEVLLNKHLNHWIKVRRKWQKAAQENEGRYSESKVILQSMFKRWGHQG